MTGFHFGCCNRWFPAIADHDPATCPASYVVVDADAMTDADLELLVAMPPPNVVVVRRLHGWTAIL